MGSGDETNLNIPNGQLVNGEVKKKKKRHVKMDSSKYQERYPGFEYIFSYIQPAEFVMCIP